MITLLIVSDIRLYRDGIARMLSGVPGLRVLGTARSAAEAESLARTLAPDVVLLDMNTPGSLDIVRSLLQESAALKVVALGVPEVESDVLACAEAGVSGYVPREGTPEDLTGTIEGVSRGEFRCSPRIAASLMRRVASLAAAVPPDAQLGRLTPRELDVARLLDQGLTNKEIATRLGIQPATAKNHVHNILGKLEVRRRTTAAAAVRGRLPRGREPRLTRT